MRPDITIVIPETSFPLDKYCCRTGTNKDIDNLLIKMIKVGVGPKGRPKKGIIEVTMAALTVMTLRACNISLNA
ncbi:regulator [Pantoea sp. FN0307]|uniref:regulator n=1 Tax=unclassified Pantoea TaxID=2630326 RepID=UPI003CEA59F2